MIDPIVVKLNMDWSSLRKQKAELIKYAWQDNVSNKLLERIISIIDSIQDQAVEENGLTEELVFGESLGRILANLENYDSFVAYDHLRRI